MAITTYAELKTAVASWLSRSNLTASIPDFIALAESAVAYGVRSPNGGYLVEPLRVRAMETLVDITVNAQSVALPAGYLASKRFYLNSDPKQALSFLSLTDFWSRYDVNVTGKPEYFTIEGESLLFLPAPDTSYTGKMLYYKKPTAFSADGDTNTLLTNHAGLYLFGALAEAFAFVQDIEAASGYQTRFAGVVNSLNASDTEDRHSGSVLQIRTTDTV